MNVFFRVASPLGVLLEVAICGRPFETKLHESLFLVAFLLRGCIPHCMFFFVLDFSPWEGGPLGRCIFWYAF